MSINISANQFRKGLDKYLEISQNEPIIVERSQDMKVVLVSYNDYKRFTALEDAVWAKRAKAAEAEGYATPDEVDRLFKKAGLKTQKQSKI